MSDTPHPGSEYLKCEGLPRLLLQNARWEREGRRAKESRAEYLKQLLHSVNHALSRIHGRGHDLSAERIAALCGELASHGWAEWVCDEGKWFFSATSLGEEAWNGHVHETTVSTMAEAVPIVLGILYRAKTDPKLLGDPRLLGQHVWPNELVCWAEQAGVVSSAAYEALQTIRGRGWATEETGMAKDPQTGCDRFDARYRITEDGVDVFKGRRASEPAIEESLKQFRSDYPDASKVAFVMMEFGKTPAHERILSAIKNALDKHGLRAVRADDREYHDELYWNVITYLRGAGFGIAVFEGIEKDSHNPEGIERDSHNPNVALEVGYMFALEKPVCLLKDRTITTLPTDLVGKLYKDFDHQNPEQTIPNVLNKWLSDRGLV